MNSLNLLSAPIPEEITLALSSTCLDQDTFWSIQTPKVGVLFEAGTREPAPVYSEYSTFLCSTPD